MKEAKRTQITDQICKQIQLMRKGGANQVQIAALLGISATTVSRIETAGFDLNTYLVNKRESREKEKKQKMEPEQAEEQIAGQIEMELVEAKPSEMTDQVKMMRFQAAQVEKLVMKLDRMNDTMCMILRVIRKE